MQRKCDYLWSGEVSYLFDKQCNFRILTLRTKLREYIFYFLVQVHFQKKKTRFSHGILFSALKPYLWKVPNLFIGFIFSEWLIIMNCVSDLNSDAQNRRIGMGGYDPSVTSFDISTYCTPTSPPGVEEFHMLVKEGDWWQSIFNVYGIITHFFCFAISISIQYFVCFNQGLDRK